MLDPFPNGSLNKYANIFKRLKSLKTNIKKISGQSLNEYVNKFKANVKKKGKYALQIWHLEEQDQNKN